MRAADCLIEWMATVTSLLLLAAAPSARAQPGAAELGACGDGATLVSAIQSTGPTSPLVGNAVVIEGDVVGAFQAGFGGFYVQEEDTDQDADPDTSEGIFVVQGTLEVPLSTGNRVRIAGTVSEIDGTTALDALTAIEVCPAGSPATATSLTLPVDSLTDFERLEGMLIHISQTLTVTGNDDWGLRGSLDLSADGRLFQPTQLVSKGAPALSLQDQQARSRIVLDDADGTLHPNPIPYKDPDGTRRIGDTVASLTGILDQRHGSYRVQPTLAPSFANENPRPPAPLVFGRIQIATLSLNNYFTSLDDGLPHCGPDATLRCLGANTALEFTRQRTKLLNVLSALDSDILGLLQVENDASASVANLAAGLNDLLGASTYTYVDTGVIGTSVSKVALLYKAARVKPVGAFAVLTSAIDPRFSDTKNRPVLAQTFVENLTEERLTLAVSDLKDRDSDCNDSGDPDLDDGQGRCNLTRTTAAQAVADWLATDPTQSGDADRLLIGNFNAYAGEDPILTLKASGYESLTDSYAGPWAYSFQAHGLSGYVDDAFVNPALSFQVTSVAHLHSNTDEPSALDYNLEARTDDLYDGDAPFRASNHDALLVGLDLTPPAAPAPPTAVPAAAPAQALLTAAALLLVAFARLRTNRRGRVR